MFTVIKLSGVAKSFDLQLLYHDVTIKIVDGEKILLTGANGVGKTTLLNIIMKNLTPTKGSVIYSHPIRIACLVQLPYNLDTRMRCLDLLEQFSADSKGDWIKEYADYFDDDFWDKRMNMLSGGELTQFFIFITLLQDFDLLVLDEPTTFVDDQVKNRIIAMINACPQTVIMVSHDADLLDQFVGTRFFFNDQTLKQEVL